MCAFSLAQTTVNNRRVKRYVLTQTGTYHIPCSNFWFWMSWPFGDRTGHRETGAYQERIQNVKKGCAGCMPCDLWAFTNIWLKIRWGMSCGVKSITAARRLDNCISQQTREIHSMLVWCWASVEDAGPTLYSIGWISRVYWVITVFFRFTNNLIEMKEWLICIYFNIFLIINKMLVELQSKWNGNTLKKGVYCFLPLWPLGLKGYCREPPSPSSSPPATLQFMWVMWSYPWALKWPE